MKFLGFLVWLMVFTLQLSLWPQITERVLPAFAFATALAWGMVVNPRTGLWLALGSGAALDLYAQHDFGMVTLASLAGYGAAWLITRNYPVGSVSWGPVLAAAGAGAVLYELVVLVWTALSVDNFPFLAEAFGTGTLNAMATFVAFLIAAGLASAALSRLAGSPKSRGHEGSLRYR